MDAVSAGRMELGIVAGWKRDEWLAYRVTRSPSPSRCTSGTSGLRLRATRVHQLAAYRATGISRVQALVRGSATSDGALLAFAADVRAAGGELA